MNNENELTAALAQSLKAAAEKVTPGEWRRASTQFNGITSTPFMLGRKEVMIAVVSEKRDAEFIAMANPANILSLVDALEKAQAENTAGVAGMAESYETTISMLRSRIAELESRTVTVKLPDYMNTYKSPVADEVEHQVRLALELFSSAAGIKVEAE